MMFQARSAPKLIFAFTSTGPKLQPALLHSLSAKTYETCVDGHEFRYSLLHTFKQKRDVWIEKMINGWNKEQISDATRIQLHKFDSAPIIVTYTTNYGDTMDDDVIYKTIRDYAARKEATYERWDRDLTSRGTNTSKNDRLQRDLDIDMVSPGPAQASRRKRSAEVALDESDDSDEQSAESDQPTAMRLKRTARLIDPRTSGQQAASAIVAPVGQPSPEKINELMDKVDYLTRQVAVLTSTINANHQESSVLLQTVADNDAKETILCQQLDTTTRERDDERLAKRSQAGKMSVVSKDRNELRVKLAQIEAQQQRSIENEDVIREVRLGRAEARANDALVLASVRTLSPLGNQADKMPFTDSIMTKLGLHQHYMEFSENLEENYSKASIMSKRCDVPQVVKFPEFAKMRAFMHGLGVILDNPENVYNLDNSPAKHRFDLALYSGPIYSESTFNKMKQTMERIEEYVCDECSQDDTVYDAIAGDAFLEPEVGAFLMCRLFSL